MRRPVALFALLAPAALAQAPKPDYPPLNLAVAKLAATSAPLDGPATAVAFSADKGLLLASTEAGGVLAWSKPEGKDWLAADAKPTALKGHSAFVTAVAAGAGTAASADADGKVLVWALPAAKPAHTLSVGKPVRAVAVSADGKTVAAAGDDGAVQLWEASSGKALRKLSGPEDWLLAVAFSPDAKQVAAGGQDGKLWLWDADSGKKLFDVPAQAAPAPKDAPVNVVAAVAFSPDGKQLAVGGRDPRVLLFQADDGKFVRALTGHTGAVTALAYHPGGAALASASKDRGLRLWNPATGAALKTLDGHTAWAEGAAFLESGTRLASAGADKTVRLWDLVAPPKK